MSENGFFSTYKAVPELFNNYLSFCDLLHAQGFEQAWKAQDVKAVEDILYEHGADIKFGWQLNYCHHRPRTSNQAVYSVRFDFKSRRDAEWKATGLITIEEMLEDCNDPGIRTEMRLMSRTESWAQVLENLGEADETDEEDSKDKK